jgi:hypothetical protein
MGEVLRDHTARVGKGELGLCKRDPVLLLVFRILLGVPLELGLCHWHRLPQSLSYSHTFIWEKLGHLQTLQPPSSVSADSVDAHPCPIKRNRSIRGGAGNSDRSISGSLAQPKPWRAWPREGQAQEKDEKESRIWIQGPSGLGRDSGRQDTGGMG